MGFLSAFLCCFQKASEPFSSHPISTPRRYQRPPPDVTHCCHPEKPRRSRPTNDLFRGTGQSARGTTGLFGVLKNVQLSKKTSPGIPGHLPKQQKGKVFWRKNKFLPMNWGFLMPKVVYTGSVFGSTHSSPVDSRFELSKATSFWPHKTPCSYKIA